MKNAILLLFILSLIPISIIAQIQNGGFETWDNVFLYETPVEWRTTNVELPGTDAAEKSTDAQAGNFSINLQTVIESGDTLFGFVLMGDAVGDVYTGVPYAGNISGVKVYLKFDIQTGDSALFLVAASYQGEAYEPDIFYIHGAQANWTEFNYTFAQSMQVDSITIGFASSDAINGSAVSGSWIRVDNISLQGSNAPALTNHSFETWNDISYDKPDGWFINQYAAGLVEPVVKSTNAYSGSYAVQILTVENDVFDGDTITGFLTNGNFNETSDSLIFSGGAQYNEEPDTLIGYYISTEETFGLIRFWNDAGIVEEQFIELLPAGNSYQTFIVPLDLSAAPDSMLIYFFGGEEIGSSLHLDGLTFIGGNVGIQELDIINSLKTYPNPSSHTLHYSYSINKPSTVQVMVYDISGRSVYSGQEVDMNPGNHEGQLDVKKLNAGTYLLNLVINGQVYEQKIIVE